VSRPSWDEYFMELAKVVSKRSTCLRQKVGAIIVKDKRILTTGYNGAPSGLEHCLDIGCLREKLGVPSGERQELCLAPDVEVLTNRGFVEISKIKEGDYVLTHKNLYRKVSRVVCRSYRGMICIVKPAGLLPIKLTPEHEVLAVKTTRCFDGDEICDDYRQNIAGRNFYCEDCEEWIPAILLEKGDFVVLGFETGIEDLKNLDLSKYVNKPSEVYIEFSGSMNSFENSNCMEEVYSARGWKFASIGSPKRLFEEDGICSIDEFPSEVEVNSDLMWLFGIYLANGCTSGNLISFSLKGFELDVEERIVGAMGEFFDVNPLTYKRVESTLIVFKSRTLATVFENMFGGNAYAKRIPIELMRVKPKLQRHMLMGWLKCDCYGEGFDATGFTTSKTLALQMYQVCLRMNILPTLDIKSSDESVTYTLRIKGNQNSRKGYIKEGRLYTMVSYVKTEFYNGKVYNLEVERDNSFTTESFTVHNCRGLHAEQNAIIQAAKFGISIEGATLYTTHCPCITCAKMIINAGIKRVVYGKDYADKRGLELLKKAGIEVVYFPID